MSLNKCMIIGNLGRDPEMRYTASGVAVTQFSVAVNRNSRDEAGEWKEETEWFRVVIFREPAERAAERLRKGSKVYVEGRIQTRQYEKDGQTRYITELLAERCRAARAARPQRGSRRVPRRRCAAVPGRPAPRPPPHDPAEGAGLGDDDLDSIPF